MTHPGLKLGETMAELDMSFKQVSTVTGIPEIHIVRMVSGDKRITPMLSRLISKAFQTDPLLWSALQQAADEHRGEELHAAAERERLCVLALRYAAYADWFEETPPSSKPHQLSGWMNTFNRLESELRSMASTILKKSKSRTKHLNAAVGIDK
jgi:plasmid maintenance system antidote protein VapI